MARAHKDDESKRLIPGSTPLVVDAMSDDDKRDTISVLLFEVGVAPYAVGVEHTEGVVDCPKITPLPNAPEGISGVASVRGRMTVVMDLGSKTGADSPRRRLILVKGESQIGLIADRVSGVLALEPKKVHPVAHGKDSLTHERAEFAWPALRYFKDGKTRVPILDLDRLGEG